ncbi:MAG TPA: universal stress protein [Polyangia bacterium]|nr:universal stress protein [Polyangia bacterium]
MKPILVAVDFSACSRDAIKVAAALAQRLKASLILAHAVGAPPLEVPVVPVGVTGQHVNMVISAEAELARDASEVRRRGISVETRVVVGSASNTIAALAEEAGVGLVVMGTHGRKGAAHLFLGSVAEHVVRSVSCPVLVTRDGIEPDLGRWEGTEPLRMLVATDGSLAGDAALAWAGSFSRSNGCDLALLRLYWPWEELVRYGLDDIWADRPRDRELLLALERDVQRQAARLTGTVLSRLRLRAAGQHDTQTIVEEASLAGSDVLVVGIPGHRMGQRVIIAPKGMLRSCPIPVLCVPEALAPVGIRSSQGRAEAR